jgi:hypothetical protein
VVASIAIVVYAAVDHRDGRGRIRTGRKGCQVVGEEERMRRPNSIIIAIFRRTTGMEMKTNVPHEERYQGGRDGGHSLYLL